MARYSAYVRTGAGSSTLPIISLYAVAGTGAIIREVGVSNTTTTAVAIKLVRISTAGTVGSGLTEAKHDPESIAAQCLTFATHSSTGPTTSEMGYGAVLGAAVGSGIIWTFGDRGIRIASIATDGFGVLPVGTGQVCDAYIVWDE